MKTSLALLAAPMLFAGSLHAADDLVLTRDGHTDYVIVVPRGASPATGRGGRELSQHLKLMSGADIRIIDDSSPAPAHAILLGIAPLGDTLFDEAMKLATNDQQRRDVSKARMWLRYVKLVMEPRDDTVFDAFLTDARAFGITSLNEGGTLESWAGWYHSR